MTDDAPVFVDDDGFAIEPLESLGDRRTREFSEFAGERMVILLGEPGSGKSTLLRATPCDILIDLGCFSTEQGLMSAFRDEPRLFVTGPVRLHLDALDECSLHIRRAGELVAAELDRVENPQLQVRIACRSGAWSPGLTERLHAALPGSEPKLVFTAPLTRSSVVRRLKFTGVDAEQFLTEVSARGVGMLAARPITLKLLTSVFIAHGSLPSGRVQLYGEACTLLLDEPIAARRTGTRPPAADIAEALHLASVVAAVQMLTGATRLVRQAASLVESLEATNLDAIDLGPRALQITSLWSCGLLEPAPGDGKRWIHKSIGEFLAARALSDSPVPAEELLDQLGAADGAVSPALHEVVAWLASMRPDVRERLHTSEPEILLRADLAGLPPAERLALAERLLASAESGRWTPEGGQSALYARLSCAGLAEVIRPHLTPNHMAISRNVAIDLAEATGTKEVLDELIGIVLNVSDQDAVRVNAAYAFIRLAPPERMTALMPFITGSVAGDEDLDLLGLALRSLWPTHITLQDVLTVLSQPGPSGYFGAWWSWISHEFPATLDDEQLLVVFQWWTHDSAHADAEDGVGFRWKSILERAWRQVDQPPMRSAWGDLLRTSDSWHAVVESSVVQQDADLRRGFASWLFEQEWVDSNRWGRIEHLVPGIVVTEDFPWLLSVWEGRGGAPSESLRWATRFAFRTDLVEHVDALSTISARVASLYEEYRGLLEPIELDSPEAQNMRKQYERMARPESPLIDPTPEARLRSALARAEAEPKFWQSVLATLTLEPRSKRYGDWFERRVPELPGWVAADTDTRIAISTAALRFLATYEPDLGSWLGSRNLPHGAMAGVAALRLLHEADFPVGIWDRWAGTVLALLGLIRSEDAPRLRASAIARAPTEWRSAALLLAEVGQDEHDRMRGVEEAARAWNDEIELKFRERLATGNDSPGVAERMMEVLIERDVLGWRDLVGARLSAGDAHAFVAVLMAAPQEAEQWVDELVRNPEMADAVCRELGHIGHFRGQWSARAPSRVLGCLYRHLQSRYPRDADPNIRGVHVVGPREELGTLRDSLLSSMRDRAARSDVDELEGLMTFDSAVRWSLQEARLRWRRRSWTPLESRGVLRLLRGEAVRTTNPASHEASQTSYEEPGMSMDQALEVRKSLPTFTTIECATTRELRNAIADRPAVVVLEGPSKSGKTVAWNSCIEAPSIFRCAGPVDRSRLEGALTSNFDGAATVVVDDAHLLGPTAMEMLAGFAKALFEENMPRQLVIVGVPPAGASLLMALPDIADRVSIVTSAGLNEMEMNTLLDTLCARANVELTERVGVVAIAQGSAHIARRLVRQVLKDAGLDVVPESLITVRNNPGDSAAVMARVIWGSELKEQLRAWWRRLLPGAQAQAANDLYDRQGGLGDGALMQEQFSSAPDGIRRLLGLKDGKLAPVDERFRFVLAQLDRTFWEGELAAPLLADQGLVATPVRREEAWQAKRVLHAAGNEGIFLLGSGEQRVTIRDQQVRALNLVRALTEVFGVGHLGVIGGGFGGCTAAVAAARAGWKVSLWETRGSLMAVHSSALRFVHPTAFDWPREGALGESAGLPLMDWRAGPVNEVVRQLIPEVNNAGIDLHLDATVRSVKGASPKVFADNSAPTQVNAVLVCAGFGVEEHQSYWEMRGKAPDDVGSEIHISGSGDSGLIEVLDYSIRDFNYHSDLSELAAAVPAATCRALQELDRNFGFTTPPTDLQQEYKNLDWGSAEIWSALARRRDHKVVLHANADRSLFTPRSALLNRVAVFLLIRSGRISLQWTQPENLPKNCLLRHGPPVEDLQGYRVPRPFTLIGLPHSLLRDVASRACLDVLREPHPSTLDYFSKLIR